VKAQELTERIRSSRDTWTLDRGRVEQAVSDHLTTLNVDPIPSRWADNVVAGYGLVHDIGWSAILQSAVATPGFTKADLPRFWAAAAQELKSPPWSTAWSVARDSVMSESDDRAQAAARATDSLEAARRVLDAAISDLRSCVATAEAAGSAAEDAGWTKSARKAVAKAAKKATWATLAGAHPRAAVSVAAEAVKAVAWADQQEHGSASLQRIIAVTTPFIDAFESGLFLFWVTRSQIVLVPR
jgi:hypothetical protein